MSKEVYVSDLKHEHVYYCPEHEEVILVIKSIHYWTFESEEHGWKLETCLDNLGGCAICERSLVFRNAVLLGKL